MNKVYVTKSFLPPIEEYQGYLTEIWSNNQLTNQGPILKRFEKAAANYLKVNSLQFVTNGTIALQLAIRALGITEGEIITSPFSYVATASAILWERCRPVFVDIEPESLCIDASKIEAAITDKTKAIMPVHVYGHPCDVEKIEAIAQKHHLKVIYDGAHAFGSEYNGKSLLNYGDISVSSFHSTKPFHTIEGGCLIARDNEVNKKIELMKRFGHDYDEHKMLGINAKASEFQAAMGLCNLKYIEAIIDERKSLSEIYTRALNPKFKIPKPRPKTKRSFAYFPVIFGSKADMLDATQKLMAIDVYPRRYFHPSLNKLPYLKTSNSCPISEDISEKILCLPLYPGLDNETVNKICEIVTQ